MSEFIENQQEEELYLNKTIAAIKKELLKEEVILKGQFKSVIASRKEMWQDSVHSSEDFDRIPEMNHYLTEVNLNTRNFNSIDKKIRRYNKMLESPYFGRFDFIEEGFDDLEKIYIGIYSLHSSETDDILIHDWRAPVSSIFYRNELGIGSFKAPAGIVTGDILLKRQYKIQDSKLKYFFDSSIRINDEILQEVLCRNSSSKMKSIVETIQKEQDIIIRDIENGLLIVQGVAGSGKTSIALHRIAFLLYEGLNSKLDVNNVIIISPNSTFSKYISNVLPELGEENVEEITFEDIISKHLREELVIQSRQSQVEALLDPKKQEDFLIMMQSIEFKGSKVFIQILDRLIEYCEKKLISFKDVYYDGEIIEKSELLRNFFLNNKIKMPIVKRLKRIENMILNKVHPMREKRLKKIQKVVQENGNHPLEIKVFSRLLAVKEAKNFVEYLHNFTELDYMHLYKLLFCKEELFLELSYGLEIPKDINKIIENTKSQFEKGCISYEDCSPLMYIKFKIEDNDDFSQIKQVVIDEAQDYYPAQYEVFKLLFKEARYTVLGDFNQTIERQGDNQLYDDIEKILNKKKSVKLSLNKSYRSSFEINSFNQKLLNAESGLISFERHEHKPSVLNFKNQHSMEIAISEDVNKYFDEGYGSIAIICKTIESAKQIFESLKGIANVKLFDDSINESNKTALIIPSYMAKGLEFDVVLVYNVSAENYNSEFDRRLLYIACTRALHRLSVYYIGEKSPLIN